MVAQLKAAEDERLAEEAALRESTEDTNETEKKPGSSVSKGEKPKSGKYVQFKQCSRSLLLSKLPVISSNCVINKTNSAVI